MTTPDETPNLTIRPAETGPVVQYVPWPGPPVRAASGGLLEVLRLALLGALTLLLIGLAVGLLIVVLMVAGSVSTMTSTLGSVGGQVDRSVEAARSALSTAGQNLTDLTDPTHPPRSGVIQDTEFDALRKVRVGDVLGEAAGYRFTLQEIRVREVASPAEYRQFGVVHRELITPRERSILGLPLPAERDAADFYLDRGELFQIGATLFKVNWLSATQQQLAIAALRNPDQAAGPIKFRAPG